MGRCHIVRFFGLFLCYNSKIKSEEHNMEIKISAHIDIDCEHFDSISKEVKESIMCKKLNELSGMTPANILANYPTDPSTYATDMKDILKKMGVSVITYDFSGLNNQLEKNIIGAIVLNEDKLAVFVSKKLTQEEQRFVLAHELGHCCKHASSLRNQKIELACDFDSDNQHELEAHVFADELLLPEKQFRDLCSKFSGSIDISLLSEIFCVPSICIRRRMLALDIK